MTSLTAVKTELEMLLSFLRLGVAYLHGFGYGGILEAKHGAMPGLVLD